MNEYLFGKKIRQILNGGSLGPQVEARLRAARERAISRQRDERSAALAWAGGGLRSRGWPALALYAVVSLTLLAGSAAAVYSWQQSERIAEIAEIDSQLLTDDLPIDAYLDRGFQTWLKKRSADD
jgi:hypothetical protein